MVPVILVTPSWAIEAPLATLARIHSNIEFPYRCIDKPGLLLKSHGDRLTPAQASFARDDNEWPSDQKHDLHSVIHQVKPHVLIGTSTKPKAFTEDIVREMAKHVDRPIIFPLSNPTRLHEAQPSDLYEWTDGKALVATGSPFPPVEYGGRKYDIGKWLLAEDYWLRELKLIVHYS
jgi:malate dehydrogenase (oxaloacetate-decarboxylating)